MASKKLRNVIKCKKPSSWWGATWREGFFSGNGFIGANAFGGAVNETVLLNARDLTWQDRTNVVPDVSAKVKDARKLIDKGEYLEAQGLYPQALIQKNFRPSPALPLPLCELKIRTHLEKNVKDFTRELNMENGEIATSFSDGSTKYFRNMFVSRSDNSVVCEFKKSGSKALDIELSFEPVNTFNNRTGNSIVAPPDGMSSKYEKYFMYFSGRLSDGFDFGAIAKLSHYGGTQTVNPNSIRITGADKILIVIKLFSRAQKEKEWSNLKNALTSNKDTYEKMLKSHSVIHSKYFNSAELEFGGDGDKDRDGTAESLLKETQENELPSALVEKLWSFGRYLFVSGCDLTGRVFLPTGLWNGEYKNQKAAINNAGVIQACYKQALGGNLSDFMNPFFDYYEHCFGDFKDNAMRLFDVHGIFIPANCAPETGRLGSVKPESLYFTGCAALVSRLFYEYYLFTQDAKFLKTRALPFLTETATFYEEFLTVAKSGEVTSSPGSSPVIFNDDTDENEYIIIGKNATVDFVLAKQSLTDAIEASRITNSNKDRIGKWQELLDKLPPLPVKDGLIQVYAAENNQIKPSAAMLWAAYPCAVIDSDSSDDDVKAVVNTAKDQLNRKSVNQTSTSMAALSAIFARLGEKGLAVDSLSNIVKGSVINNLVALETDWTGMGYLADSVWASMQLSGNLTLTDAIQHMLVSGKGDTVTILPVHLFPNENLSFSGMQCPGGFEVDLDYQAKNQNLVLNVKSKKNSTFSIKLPPGIKKVIKLMEGSISDDLSVISQIELKAGKSASYSFKYSPSK